MANSSSSVSDQKLNKYLFDYDYDGSSWSLEIPAHTEQEAKERVGKLANAKYLGEIKATLPGRFGLLVKLICGVRNLIAKRQNSELRSLHVRSSIEYTPGRRIWQARAVKQRRRGS